MPDQKASIPIVSTLAAIAALGFTLAQRAEKQDASRGSDRTVVLEGTIPRVQRPLVTLQSRGETSSVHLGPLPHSVDRACFLGPGDRVTLEGRVEKKGQEWVDPTSQSLACPAAGVPASSKRVAAT